MIIERIVQLLAKSWDEGAPLKLSTIVAITFTRKATRELTDRLGALTGVPPARLAAVVSTIHELARRTLTWAEGR